MIRCKVVCLLAAHLAMPKPNVVRGMLCEEVPALIPTILDFLVNIRARVANVPCYKHKEAQKGQRGEELGS